MTVQPKATREIIHIKCDVETTYTGSGREAACRAARNFNLDVVGACIGGTYSAKLREVHISYGTRLKGNADV